MLVTSLVRQVQRRRRISEAILAAYDQVPAGRVRRLEVARRVAETIGVATVSPAFQLEVIRAARALGARTVSRGNARYYRGLAPRAAAGNL